MKGRIGEYICELDVFETIVLLFLFMTEMTCASENIISSNSRKFPCSQKCNG